MKISIVFFCFFLFGFGVLNTHASKSINKTKNSWQSVQYAIIRIAYTVICTGINHTAQGNSTITAIYLNKALNSIALVYSFNSFIN